METTVNKPTMYVLPQRMSGIELQVMNGNPGFMSEAKFMIRKFFITSNPENKGKYFLAHHSYKESYFFWDEDINDWHCSTIDALFSLNEESGKWCSFAENARMSTNVWNSGIIYIF